MIKRILSIILCCIVLLSFSLTSFASSYSTLAYENINSIQESFIASFLSHCGLEVEFFDWDNDYTGSEFKNAAYFNLTRSFANYVFINDSKMSNKILEYASSCGVDSSIHSSSYVWEGSFKDCSSIVNQLVYHLYNYLSGYLNTYNWYHIPLNMYIGDYEEKFTGCYTQVDFSGYGSDLDSWYNNVGKTIQAYCTGDYVDDDFLGCNISYYWDYNKLPLGYDNYVRVLSAYIDDYNNSSSGGSGSDSPSGSGGGSSESDPLEFANVFYRPLFLGLISSFGFDMTSCSNSLGVANMDSAALKSDVLKLVDHLYDVIIDESSYYITNYYPNMKRDFLSVCGYERVAFTNMSVYSYNPFTTLGNANEVYRRFTLGFYELFYYEFLNTSNFGGSPIVTTRTNLLSFDGSYIRFIFNHGHDNSYSNWLEDYKKRYTIFLMSYDKKACSIPVFKDVDMYFSDWVFNGFDLPLIHQENVSEGLYWHYNPDYVFDTEYNIIQLTDNMYFLYVGDNFGILSYFTNFIVYTAPFFAFLSSIISILPAPLTFVIFGGFLLSVCFGFMKILLKG